VIQMPARVSSILMMLRKAPASLLAGYVLFGLFMVLESALRRGGEAQSSTAGSEDQGTTRTLGGAYGAGLLIMPLFAMLRTHRRVPALTGPSLMVLSIALRSWAALTLGRYYTRTLRTAADQPVIRTGPYRFVRHPGYLGTQLLWVGFGLSAQNWIAGAAWGALMFVLYRQRISAEEAMLLRKVGPAYAEYMASTPQLIPGMTRRR
jgi:protein-S-isoprenylcysteine O-methyltransferase Ste14